MSQKTHLNYLKSSKMKYFAGKFVATDKVAFVDVASLDAGSDDAKKYQKWFHVRLREVADSRAVEASSSITHVKHDLGSLFIRAETVTLSRYDEVTCFWNTYIAVNDSGLSSDEIDPRNLERFLGSSEFSVEVFEETTPGTLHINISFDVATVGFLDHVDDIAKTYKRIDSRLRELSDSFNDYLAHYSLSPVEYNVMNWAA